MERIFTSLSLDCGACATGYDGEMVTPGYPMGINYPVSLQVRKDLQSTDKHPARREKFCKLLPHVNNVQRAKKVIT